MRAGVLFALIIAGLVVIVSPAAPAWACSCAWSPAEQDRHADQTVAGTVTEVTSRDIALAVEWAEKGAATPGATVRLKVGPGGGSCGYDFRLATRYRVNSMKGETGLCIGVTELPAAATPATATTEAPAPTTAVAQPPPTAQRPDRTWWLVAGTGGVALIAVVGVALVLRRRRG